MGTKEGRGSAANARELRDALVSRGWRLGKTLQYMEARGATHSELAWAERVEPMLRFLYPAPKPRRSSPRASRRR
jgi:hypothetical protein